VITALRGRPQAGHRFEHEGASLQAGRTTVTVFSYSLATPLTAQSNLTDYAGTMTLAMAPLPQGGTQVRVDVHLAWAAPRSAASLIPTSGLTGSVTRTVGGPTPSTTRTTLTPTAASTVAQDINGLLPSLGVVVTGCGLPGSSITQITLVHGHDTWTTGLSCVTAEIIRNGAPVGNLTLSQPLEKTLTALLPPSP
jgi:hypothetical protein